MAEKKRSEPTIVDAVVMILDKPTKVDEATKSGGNIYPQSLAEEILLEIMTGKAKYDIEEVSPVERRLKKKMPFEAWTEDAVRGVD